MLNLTLAAYDIREMAHISLHFSELVAVVAILLVLTFFVIIWAYLAWVFNMPWNIYVSGSWAGLSLAFWRLC